MQNTGCLFVCFYFQIALHYQAGPQIMLWKGIVLRAPPLERFVHDSPFLLSSFDMYGIWHSDYWLYAWLWLCGSDFLSINSSVIWVAKEGYYVRFMDIRPWDHICTTLRHLSSLAAYPYGALCNLLRMLLAREFVVCRFLCAFNCIKMLLGLV